MLRQFGSSVALHWGVAAGATFASPQRETGRRFNLLGCRGRRWLGHAAPSRVHPPFTFICAPLLASVGSKRCGIPLWAERSLGPAARHSIGERQRQRRRQHRRRQEFRHTASASAAVSLASRVWGLLFATVLGLRGMQAAGSLRDRLVGVAGFLGWPAASLPPLFSFPLFFFPLSVFFFCPVHWGWGLLLALSPLFGLASIARDSFGGTEGFGESFPLHCPPPPQALPAPHFLAFWLVCWCWVVSLVLLEGCCGPSPHTQSFLGLQVAVAIEPLRARFCSWLPLVLLSFFLAVHGRTAILVLLASWPFKEAGLTKLQLTGSHFGGLVSG